MPHSRKTGSAKGDTKTILEDLAKKVDRRVLAAQESVRAAGDEEAAKWQEHETVTLRGRRSETVLAVPKE